MAEKEQTELVRCLLGNPFRPIPVLDSTICNANDSAVLNMAREIYTNHTFHDLPFLCDALEDAGCKDKAILAHCRDDKLHARGCFVLDLILRP